MSHTPGPWRVGYKNGHNVNLIVPKNNDDTICSVYGLPLHSNIKDLEKYPDVDRWQEGLANARLIAAAPDLLKAMKAAIAQTQDWQDTGAYKGMTPECQKVYDDCKAAIAKAEGK